MDLRRLSWGEWLAGASGVVLIVALFLPWYSAGGNRANAWQTMAFDDVILCVTASLAIAAAFIVAVRRLAGVSVAATSLAILPAAVTVVVTIYRLVSPAPAVDVSLDVGAWLALAAALGIGVGAWNGAIDEGPARRNPALEREAARAAFAKAELVRLNGPSQN